MPCKGTANPTIVAYAVQSFVAVKPAPSAGCPQDPVTVLYGSVYVPVLEVGVDDVPLVAQLPLSSQPAK